MTTIITSSGIIKNAEKPRIGIISANSVNSDFLHEVMTQGIDLGFQNFKEDLEKQGLSDDEIDEKCEHYYSEENIYLYGDFERVNGGYRSIENGKHGFALFYSTGTDNLAIEYSKTLKPCNNTSPCYVMANGDGPCGDLDSAGDNVIAYALPIDCLNNE